MRKKELLEIPVAEPTCTMNRELKKYLLVAHEESLKNNTKVLVVEVYYSLNLEPNYRIFLTDNDDITLDCTGDERTWKTGTIYQYTSYSEKHFSNDAESDNIIRKFCNSEQNEKGFQMIINYQRYIRDKKIQIRNKKITDPWDKVMDTVPEEPIDFKEWVVETAMSFSRYIFYKYTGKKVQAGWCSYCKKDIEIGGAIDGNNAVCPCCNSKVILRAERKISSIYDNRGVFLIQKVDGRLLIRKYDASRRLRKNEEGWLFCEDSLYESKRIFINLDGKVDEAYSHEYFKQREVRWVKCNANLIWLGSGSLYSRDIEEVLENTIYKHAGLKKIAEYEPGFEFNVGRFLAYYNSFPFVEYLIKNQLCEIARDCINGNNRSILDQDAKTLDKLLKIEKYDLKFLQENKANITGLEYLQERRKNNQKPIAEHMEFVQTIFKGNLREFLELTKYAKPGKVIKYLKANKRISIESKRGYVKLWCDYLGMAERLRYDLSNDFVVFPKYLKLRHDQCIDIINEQREQEKIKAKKQENLKVKKRYIDTLEKYGLEYKDLIIMVPKAAEDIIKEGHDMHHCVGGYVSNVAQGKTTILFIRKKDNPTQSYYTMEVKNNEVIQCRGKYNAGMTPDVSSFVQRFKKEKLGKKRRKAS